MKVVGVFTLGFGSGFLDFSFMKNGIQNKTTSTINLFGKVSVSVSVRILIKYIFDFQKKNLFYIGYFLFSFELD